MQNESHAISGKRRKTGNVLIFLIGLLLIGSAAAKFAQLAPVVAQMSASGFGGMRLQLVAILEVVSALLLLVPVTRSSGVLMVSAFLGGAIATHMGHGQPVLGPAAVLGLAWLGAWLRHPEILWSVRRNSVGDFSGLTPEPRSEGFIQQF